MARPPPGTLLTPRVREPRSNKQTCAGNISADLTFLPTVGSTPILPGLRALSAPGGCLRPSGGLVVKYRADLRRSVPLWGGGFRAAEMSMAHRVSYDNPRRKKTSQQPPFTLAMVGKKVLNTPVSHPRGD